LDGKQVLIGSSHFIFEDSRVPGSDEAERETRLESDQGRSLLYMAYGAKLVGMLAIEDPIRPDAAKTLAGLSRNGIGRIVMLTGDSERTAQAVAEKLGIGSFRANLLPAEKAAAIGKLKKEGHKVIFIGDGVNDSPALSAADVGVSLKDGSDIAKEVAGVVLMDGRLSSLATVRVLSRRVMDRINRQFGFIMLLNSVLLGLGLFGGITPRLAALLHNLGTVLVTANSVKGILAETDVDDGGGA
jgi:Cu2+-exporting ATPase